jgi:perosamine synthetase
MPVRIKPLPVLPPRFDLHEPERTTQPLLKNVLWYWNEESTVTAATAAIAKKFGSPYVVATSSGTASVHSAVAACRMPPGTEVIVPPITDVGTIVGILYQNLIPVFADVDLDSSNVTAETIRSVLTEHTGAVIAVHLAGCPCEIGPIAELCRQRGIHLIEDCAQGLGATYRGQHIGTFGRFGCYSLNDQKHITCGEGGFILMKTQDDYLACHNYADKFYDRERKGVRLTALAPNYRMSELDGAMTLAQLPKLDPIVEKRRVLGEYLNLELSGIKGIIPQSKPSYAQASYFFYLFRYDKEIIKTSQKEFLDGLQAEGIPATGVYMNELLYKTPFFTEKSFFPGGIWPAEVISGRHYDYRSVNLRNSELLLLTSISLRLHQGFEIDDIKDYVAAIQQVVAKFT